MSVIQYRMFVCICIVHFKLVKHNVNDFSYLNYVKLQLII